MKIERWAKLRRPADERLLLDDSLRPALMFVRCTGVLPDFYREKEEIDAPYAARIGLTCAVALLISTYAAFELYQVFSFTVSENETLLMTTMIFMLLVMMLEALFLQYQSVSHAKEFQQFFKDWKKVEMQNASCFIGTKRKTMTAMYIFYLIPLIIPMVISTIWNIQEPAKPIFLSSLSPLYDAIGPYLLALVTVLCFFFVHVYKLQNEIVSAVFFYQASCAVEGLKNELRNTADALLRVSSPLSRRVWNRYESIFRMVNRANRLFQATILTNHASSFILNTIGIYYSLKSYREKPLVASGIMTYVIMGIIRSVLTNHMMSRLCLSRGELRSTVAAQLCQKWYSMPEENRLFLISFQERLNEDNLAAIPFDLYKVNPSNLLSILSLTVTYTIVLLQSKPESQPWIRSERHLLSTRQV